ncbi:hypothetical protein [Ornithinibacillus xuwenensis]|uniref:Uncharacterized protein n=1 Tax=Ornithinibacillus xuwenensis TaxID=3144668 RepID=A0ABU9XBV4_9BACI
MTVKEYFEWAVKNGAVDLYTLIMFLVYEKKALSFADTKDKLLYYMQDKYKNAMSKYLTEYKIKLNIHYKPTVYEIATKNLSYSTIYVVAVNEKQATSFAFSQGYLPSDISICDEDTLMTKANKKAEEINIPLKDLRDQSEEIPSFLGGF